MDYPAIKRSRCYRHVDCTWHKITEWSDGTTTDIKLYTPANQPCPIK